MSGYRLNLRSGAIVAVVGAITDQATHQAAEVTRGRVQANIQRLPRIDSGRMRDTISIAKHPAASPLRPMYRIYSDLPYTKYQEHGTRPHGPVRAQHLVFRAKGTDTIVFAKWVQGVQAGNFFRDALNSLSVADFM